MDEKELLKQQLEKTLHLIQSLPEDRRFYYNTGVIMVEVTKEEAQQLVKEKLEGLRGNTQT
ncbi:prefoldin subunit [Persephonella sp.]